MIFQQTPREHFSIWFFVISVIISMFLLILIIHFYRKKKSAIRMFLIVIFLAEFFFTIIGLIAYYTPGYYVEAILSLIAILTAFIVLIILNRKLSEEMQVTAEELKVSEDKYRMIIDNIIDVIFEIDLNGAFSYFSPQIKELLNYDSKEILVLEMSTFIHSEDLQLLEKSVEKMKETGDNLSIECRFIHKSGRSIPTSLRASLVKDKKGKLKKIVGIIRDITEQKRTEEIIQKQMDKLKEIDKIRTDLVRRTSHELKTPLLSIYSSSQYLLDSYKDSLNEDILKLIGTINRGGKRLKILTDNLIASYNIESRGIELKKEKVDIVKTIKQCVDDLILSIEERDLYLKFELDDSYFIEIDKMRIEQVILNILSNAIKNTPPKGFIYIKLEENSEFIDIIVNDTGIGFTESEKEKIFKKFGKIERKGEYINTEGSGLGLYISKEIVELHGGKIFVESEGRNQGSKFIVRLPI